MLLQVLGGKPAVTVVRRLFAAQETSPVQEIDGQDIFDMARPDQVEKLPLVDVPSDLLLVLVGRKDLGCRRQHGQVYVVDVADRAREKLQVVAFREPGELRGVVQANVDQPTYPGVFQPGKECFGRFPGEPNRKNRHCV